MPIRRVNKKPIVYAAMSGGVDSSVAAALLNKRGYNVVGVFMRGWSAQGVECAWKEDRRDAMRVSAKLGIPFKTYDFSREYYEYVVRYLINEYKNNRTPNPDVMCNKHIKFGLFLERALHEGADMIATGHYVRLQKCQILDNECQTNPKSQILHSKSAPSPRAANYKLQIARDANKDQSYFLWTLTQKQLKRCLFPIGAHTKPEVRALARKFGLPTAEKKDSQGVCFVGKLDMAAFLKHYIPERIGAVKTADGEFIGRHPGVSYYTIGQRHGIGISSRAPYYVAEKEIKTNTIIVASRKHEKLYKKEMNVENVSWISGLAPKMPLQVLARIRYRQHLQEATLTYADRTRTDTDNHRKSASQSELIRVSFLKSQWAPACGQSIVFYSRNAMLGGGIIA